MAILERYRRRRKRGPASWGRALVLAAGLCVLIGVMLVLGRKADDGLKQMAAPAAAEVEDQDAGAADVADDPEPGEPLPEWQKLSPDEERALLGRIVDQVPIAVHEHKEAYYYLLNKVRRMTDGEMEGLVDREIDYGDFANQPEIVRGSVVELTGHLLRLERTPLDRAKAGLAVVYEGQIMGPDRNIFSFRLTERPEGPFAPAKVRIRDNLRVRLQGIFMQVIVYQDRHQPPRNVASPLIIGRRLAPAPLTTPEDQWASWWWVAALAAAAVGMGWWMFHGMRR